MREADMSNWTNFVFCPYCQRLWIGVAEGEHEHECADDGLAQPVTLLPKIAISVTALRSERTGTTDYIEVANE